MTDLGEVLEGAASQSSEGLLEPQTAPKLLIQQVWVGLGLAFLRSPHVMPAAGPPYSLCKAAFTWPQQ